MGKGRGKMTTRIVYQEQLQDLNQQIIEMGHMA